MNWQPIETAPRDGTEVLVWDEDGPDFFLGHWDLSFRSWLSDYFDEISPTHWMPLPPAPKEGE